jgi:sulfur relay (sulfurtransferase) complex TusBCD TusD component (DsrE family)
MESLKEAGQEGATLCLLATCSPESEKSRTLMKIAEAAVQLGHNVQIFLMCDGVYHVLRRDFMKLIEMGVEITLCAHNALERGVEKRESVSFGSQYDLSQMVARSDGFMAFVS